MKATLLYYLLSRHTNYRATNSHAGLLSLASFLRPCKFMTVHYGVYCVPRGALIRLHLVSNCYIYQRPHQPDKYLWLFLHLPYTEFLFKCMEELAFGSSPAPTSHPTSHPSTHPSIRLYSVLHMIP